MRLPVAAIVLVLLAASGLAMPLAAQEQVQDKSAHEYVVRAITLAVQMRAGEKIGEFGKAVDEALSRERLILLAAQRDAEAEDPGADDLYPVGTVAMIMRMLKMPDGRVKILVQGVSRARVEEFTRRDPYFEVKIAEVGEREGEGQGLESEALVRSVKPRFLSFFSRIR